MRGAAGAGGRGAGGRDGVGSARASEELIRNKPRAKLSELCSAFDLAANP